MKLLRTQKTHLRLNIHSYEDPDYPKIIGEATLTATLDGNVLTISTDSDGDSFQKLTTRDAPC